MPFTPFHFGPGLLFKGSKPKLFDLKIFIASQVITDVETGWNILNGSERLHTTFHSYLGSLLVVCITLALWKTYTRIRKIEEDILIPLISALIGVWSHVFLDSIMHYDAQPFAPFSDVNPMLRIISLQSLHLACIIAGALGALLWLLQRQKKF